jgi:hypothetical protein
VPGGLSQKTSITIQWDPNFNTQSPAGIISGYFAYMDDGMNGQFSMVHDGGSLPSTTSVTVNGLTTGLPYRFYIVAKNIIGLSVPSNYLTVYSCTNPSGLSRPVQGTVTQSSVTISWSAPLDNGGCLVTSYSILRDDGNGGEYVEVHAAQVNNKPTLTSFTVSDLPVSALGKIVKFKVKATNVAGYTFTSFSTPIVIAAVPSTPNSPPLSDFTSTDED